MSTPLSLSDEEIDVLHRLAAPIAWHTGKRRIDEAFPLELRANTNEQEMFIRLEGGSKMRRWWYAIDTTPRWARRLMKSRSPNGR